MDTESIEITMVVDLDRVIQTAHHLPTVLTLLVPEVLLGRTPAFLLTDQVLTLLQTQATVAKHFIFPLVVHLQILITT